MTPRKKSKDESLAPAVFLESGLLKQMIETSVRNILEEEVSRHLGAVRHERSNERRGYRNGTKPSTKEYTRNLQKTLYTTFGCGGALK